MRVGDAVINTNSYSPAIQSLLHDNAANAATTAGGLTKLGAGKLTLFGANTYTGGTKVAAGTLAVADGSGTIASLVKVGGGTLGPGLSLSATRLTLSSGLQLAKSSVLALESDGTMACSGYSQISLAGDSFSLVTASCV